MVLVVVMSSDNSSRKDWSDPLRNFNLMFADCSTVPVKRISTTLVLAVMSWPMALLVV